MMATAMRATRRHPPDGGAPLWSSTCEVSAMLPASTGRTDSRAHFPFVLFQAYPSETSLNSSLHAPSVRAAVCRFGDTHSLSFSRLVGAYGSWDILGLPLFSMPPRVGHTLWRDYGSG